MASGGALLSANELVYQAIQNNTVCELPGGDSFVEEAVVPSFGLVIRGVGSHKPLAGAYVGSVLKPAPGYTGPIIQSRDSPHSVVLKDFRIDGGAGHGIDFENRVNGGGIIDNVAVLRCGGHGFLIGKSTSFRMGTVHAYSNGGSGIYSQAELLNIGTLIGDNNDECLLFADSNSTSMLNISQFRSERFAGSKGHNIVFKISMRGGCVNLGQGKIHLGANDRGAQSWIEVDTHSIIKADFITTDDIDAYQYGYKCDRTGVSYSPLELLRRPFSFGRAPIFEELY